MAKIKKPLLLLSGESEDKTIINNVFHFYETHGLPLDVIFICLMERNIVPNWINFYQAAIKAGMKHSRIISKLDEAISDSFGKEISDVVISRLDSIFKNKENK